MAERLYTLVKSQPFFKGMKAEHLRVLCDCAVEKEFGAGEWIFLEGSPANRFYILLNGKVSLDAETAGRGVVPVETLGPGDDLGWSWLLAPYYLHFSARATEPTRVLFFFGTRLREHCDQDHDFGYEILRRVVKVVVQRLEATRRQLAEPGSPAKAAAGKV
jgi:CRP-like cAMP-binding protein